MNFARFDPREKERGKDAHAERDNVLLRGSMKASCEHRDSPPRARYLAARLPPRGSKTSDFGSGVIEGLAAGGCWGAAGE